MRVRKASFSGSWYPGDAKACEKQIKAFLKEGGGKRPPGEKRVGGIVPHAGWYFSGATACNVIHCLSEGPPPDVIIIFGMHLQAASDCYMMADGAWETPFGDIPIASELARELSARFRFQIETGDHFIPDNTIELQLPFIKYFFNAAEIIPIGVPPVRESLKIGRAIAELSARLNLRVNVLGSTDLTHYGANYGFEPRGRGREALDWVKNTNDPKVIDAMLAMDPEGVLREGLSNQNACCAGAAATAIAAGKHLGANAAHFFSYTTSYDKSPSESFVGYVGVVF
ncbi:MAG: AmmeMemoRadiSam system protein B [Desulfobacterales bacterium]|nr:AmmeMemoRadiSam system protein B [Desulfobacterales bacterium]